MASNSVLLIGHRALLRVRMFAGLFGAAGCGEARVATLTTPAVEEGIRDRLAAVQEKAQQTIFKQRKKR
jgi:hypothetical protein